MMKELHDKINGIALLVLILMAIDLMGTATIFIIWLAK